MQVTCCGALAIAVFAVAANGNEGEPPTVWCRNTHEWVDLGERHSQRAAGQILVEYGESRREPLPDVQIILAQLEPSIAVYVTKTGVDGRFDLPSVPVGRYRFNACLAGFVHTEYERCAAR